MTSSAAQPTTNPGSLWDTSALMTLVSSPLAVAHMQVEGTLRQPSWTRVVPGELSRLNSRKPPRQFAGQAQRMANAWLGNPLPELPSEEQAVLDLRDRIAAGVGHPDEHLGEAQSIVIARRLGSTFVTDDGGARSEAKAEGVRSLSVWGLLAVHSSTGKLAAAAAPIRAQLVASGRVVPGLPIDIAALVELGHILM